MDFHFYFAEELEHSSMQKLQAIMVKKKSRERGQSLGKTAWQLTQRVRQKVGKTSRSRYGF